MVEQWYYQNVQYVVVKNQDLLKIKKQKDCQAIQVLEHHYVKYQYWVIFYFNAHTKLCKMNEINNQFLFAGDKSMPEMHLKQPGFTCSACGPFTENKERIQKFK